MYGGRAFQVARDVKSIICLPIISVFFNENNLQIVTNFSNVLFNNQVKALRHDGHLSKFIIVILALILKDKKYLKGVAGDANMITVSIIQASDVFISDTLK